MKSSRLLLVLLLLVSSGMSSAATDSRASKTVILVVVAVKNLRLESEVVEESEFEETVFALGLVRVAPGHRAVISSRVPGRVLEVFAHQDHELRAGDPALVIEGRQPGNPPPRILLASPISGIVSISNVTVGEPVEPDRVLAEVVDLSEVDAVARVSQQFASRLRLGQMARIQIPAASSQPFEAKVERLGSSADGETGTVEAIFRISNPERTIRPGMRAEFSIVVDRSSAEYVVPREAIQGDAINRFVFVKDFDLPNAFVKTPVVVGRTNDRKAEILSGLLPADEVVTRGAYALSFAGGGTLSLKEALDAAHGHEHAADGSELPTSGKSSPQETGTNDDSEPACGSRFWMIVSACLALLLVLTAVKKSARHA